ncbi:hypothetical protein ACRAWG_13800 [Methylobacterium sp. P31]
MKDDNPLWYDEVEPEVEPGAALLTLAHVIDGVRGIFSMTRRLYGLPDRVWGWISGRLADEAAPGA